jgi:hypothetical protein
LLLTLWLFGPLLAHLPTRILGGGDAALFGWWAEEVPNAIIHGHDPLLSGLFLHPGPVNAMWNTSMILPAIVLSPVTLLAGPIATVNLMLILAPPLSAVCAYWMCRRFATPRALAWLCGLLYGFGPFLVDESLGHIQMTMAWFPPLAIVFLHEIFVVQGRPAVRVGIVFGVLVAMQLLVGEEILAATALFGLIGLVVLMLSHPSAIARKAPYAIRAFGTAGAVALALGAWPLAVQFLGPSRAINETFPNDKYVGNLATFVAPTRMSLFDPLGIGHFTLHAGGNLSENTGYLGPPLILVALVALWWGRKDPVARFAAVMAVVAAGLSLGGRLHAASHVTRFPLPWLPFEHLPILRSLIPARFALYVLLFITLLLARGLAQPPRVTWARPVVVGAMALTAVFLWPHRPVSTIWRAPRPSFFTSSTVRNFPSQSVIILSPVTNATRPIGMLWQAESGMRFKLISGYAVPFPSDYPTDPITVALNALAQGAAVPPTISRSEIAAEIRYLRAPAVVLGPSTPNLPGAQRFFAGVLGKPPMRIGGVYVWLLQDQKL